MKDLPRLTTPYGVRDDFPMLQKKIYGHPLIYLDSAATSQKPRSVIEAHKNFYLDEYGTVHRAVYKSAQAATDLYNEARIKVMNYLHAASTCEIIFTRGTTDGINIIADSFAKGLLSSSSTIVVSEMEHHSNLVPWQMAAERSGAKLEVIPITDDGVLCLDSLQKILCSQNVVVVAITHISNLLGTCNPITKIAELVHGAGAYLVVDGAQSASHLPINVQELGCDFFCCSGHKMCGPTGVGVLWGKEQLLQKLPPTRGGGDMIDTVEYHQSTWNELPLKFEPGTPMMAEVVALGKAIDYLESLGMDQILAREEALTRYLIERLSSIEDIRLIGTAFPRGPLQSFTFPNIHPLDIATLLDVRGVAVRSGHLCCQPLVRRLGVTSVVRASLAFYNTKEDLDRFAEALSTIVRHNKN